MFRKLFITLALSLSLCLLMATGVYANDFPIKVGGLNTNVVAYGGAIDADVFPSGIGEQIGWFIGGGNGGAFAVSGAGGIAGAQAAGGGLGSFGADITAVGGGLTVSDATYLLFPRGLLSIGVISQSSNQAVTGATTDIYAKGLGLTESTLGGIAGQGTLNGSYILPSYFLFIPMDTDGITAGLAGQGSIGVFIGGSLVGLYGDAEVRALIDMQGSSYSLSFRYIEYDGNAKTEGLQTEVGANTLIMGEGYANDNHLATAHLNGGWKAAGFAKTATVQTGNYGGAMAIASGHYSGSGGLNSSFYGSASGHSATSITTVKGMKGQISAASASMHVKAGPSWLAPPQ